MFLRRSLPEQRLVHLQQIGHASVDRVDDGTLLPVHPRVERGAGVVVVGGTSRISRGGGSQVVSAIGEHEDVIGLGVRNEVLDFEDARSAGYGREGDFHGGFGTSVLSERDVVAFLSFLVVELVRSEFLPRRHGDELRFGGLHAVLLSEVVGRPDLVTGRIAGVEGEPLVAGEFLVFVHELEVVEVLAVHFQVAPLELGNVAFLVGVGAGQFAAAFGVGIAVVDGDVGLDDELTEGVGRVARLAEEEDVAGEGGGAGGGEAVDGAGEVARSSSSGVPGGRRREEQRENGIKGILIIFMRHHVVHV